MISKFGLCRVSTQVIAFTDSSSSNSEQRLSVENFQVFIKQAGNKLVETTVNHVSLYIHASPYSVAFSSKTMNLGHGRTTSR